MIFVQDEKGFQGPINSWKSFKPTGKISRLILTDNFSFYRELSGFNNYYVDREAVTVLRHGGGVANKLVKETIYGIRDLNKARQQLVEKYNNSLVKASKEGINKEHLNKISELYDKFLKRINKEEVVKYSLLIEEEKCSIEDAKIDVTHVKKGEEDSVSNDINVLPKRYWKKFDGAY